MQVLKFGGSSVANAENISKVLEIVSEAVKRDSTMLVCSAISGCTDALIEIGNKASAGDESYKDTINTLEARHKEIISKLLPGEEEAAGITNECDSLFSSLRGIAHGVFLLGELSPTSLSAIESFGEMLSTKIIATAFAYRGMACQWVDSRKLIRCTSKGVDTDVTYRAVRDLISSRPEVRLFILPGFIASDENGKTVTLGRGGSDYTAALYAAGANARRLEIWTDVSGMMTTNPKIVPTARTIKNISYRAALELSHFGAKVIYPPTIQPVVSSGIPIYVKNTFRPEDYGTRIEADPGKESLTDPIGISNSDDIALISLEGSAMVGVPGFSSRLFDALTRAGINIILITQASSVHTMCIAISRKDAKKAKAAADECFAYEISLGKLNPLKVETGFSIVCLVGDNVLEHSGATGRMLAALGSRGVPVRATAQGSSERNISVIVQSDMAKEAIRAVHSEFFDKTAEKVVNLFIAGYGTVGKALVDMINDNAESILARTGKRLRICAVSNSRKFVLDRTGVDCSHLGELLEAGTPADSGAFFSAIALMGGENSVFVDCTSSYDVCDRYAILLSLGFSVVACNKKLFSATSEKYNLAKSAALTYGKSLRYETTVGAALPIIETITRCVNSGDRIASVEAVLSGTLNYLCSNYDGGDFDALVQKAHDLGYTEPNPADDLSGKDVLRKFVILLREAGEKIEMDGISLEPFPVQEVAQRYKAAAEKGCRLRYVASWDGKKAEIGLREVAPDNFLYNLCGTDNAALIKTEDYPSPLVVAGAGAGPRQTAGGLLNDILFI